MKKLLLLALCLWSVLFVKGQSLTYEFDYDYAGNRIRRTVVQLNNRNAEERTMDEAYTSLTDRMSNGTTMTLFPNPTKESIRFELSDGDRIGDYVVSDISGRVVTKGYCENLSLTLDLSDQPVGVYLLNLFIGKKPYV